MLAPEPAELRMEMEDTKWGWWYMVLYVLHAPKHLSLVDLRGRKGRDNLPGLAKRTNGRVAHGSGSHTLPRNWERKRMVAPPIFTFINLRQALMHA